MFIYHLSMECYPVAKVGGLADVVGALPKYQNRFPEVQAKVVMPWYNKKFVHEHDFEVVFDGWIHQSYHTFQVQVFKEKENTLGFELYLVKIPGLLDRDEVYGYWDESQQFLAFQHGALHWLSAMEIRPDILHCHDYHTGLVPFMVEYCPDFTFLKGVRTIGTIHNGEYQGQMQWSMSQYFPHFDGWKWGLLDWKGLINPLASMIKCCHAFTAVSEGYLEELLQDFGGLEQLVRQERQKAVGIINGIDTEIWDPETDEMLYFNYNKRNALEGKSLNKKKLCEDYHLNPDLPLVAFIGRFATEKGADLLPEIIQRGIQKMHGAFNIMVLGSGNRNLEQELAYLAHIFTNFALDLGYKEHLSHKIYASADFLLMTSRVEPCGLNQMYAMRYGTVPLVSYRGGLKDTVKDITSGGSGLNFACPLANDVIHNIDRALHLYSQKDFMNSLIHINMEKDFSWENSAKKYLDLYHF